MGWWRCVVGGVWGGEGLIAGGLVVGWIDSGCCGLEVVNATFLYFSVPMCLGGGKCLLCRLEACTTSDNPPPAPPLGGGVRS